jgi:protoporphyrinogen oxidase
MNQSSSSAASNDVLIIGAGPAGLTSAYMLSQAGRSCRIVEKSNQVGGISRTEHFKGYYFDLGGHRFYTKHVQVEELWKEVLQGDLLRRNRLSRIYYQKRFFYYPLRPWNTLVGLGVGESLLILGSYFNSRMFPSKGDNSFEEWISNRFGRRLFNTFFKTYTEKVWGIPSSEIQAEWAQQRIKDLSVGKLLSNALLSGNGRKQKNKQALATLIEAFDYPKYGPGMMWRRMAERAREQGSKISFNSKVEAIHQARGRIEALELKTSSGVESVSGEHFLSSMPLGELVHRLRPNPPKEVLAAADCLRYRDFLTVALIINKTEVFPDNWIYVHDPMVRVGRIQNFKNWSPFMVPDQSTTCLGMEYFCFQNDTLWAMADEDLLDLAAQELSALGFVQKSDVVDGAVVRVPKAYPIYDSNYKPALNVLRRYLTNGLENLQVLGRNGMHRYNNQDHSMLTGMLAAQNILGAKHDLWQVNDEHEGYLEEGKPSQAKEDGGTLPPAVSAALAKIDSLGLAVALGTVSGLTLLLATLWLLLRGGGVNGPTLELLANFYWGYQLSPAGAVIGALYGFGTGFILGWLFAVVKNALTAFGIYRLKRKSELLKLQDFWEHL